MSWPFRRHPNEARWTAGLTSAGLVPRNDLVVHRQWQHREGCRFVEKRVLAGSALVAILSDAALPAKEGLGLLQQFGSLTDGDDRVVLWDDDVAQQVWHRKRNVKCVPSVPTFGLKASLWASMLEYPFDVSVCRITLPNERRFVRRCRAIERC